MEKFGADCHVFQGRLEALSVQQYTPEQLSSDEEPEVTESPFSPDIAFRFTEPLPRSYLPERSSASHHQPYLRGSQSSPASLGPDTIQSTQIQSNEVESKASVISQFSHLSL